MNAAGYAHEKHPAC